MYTLRQAVGSVLSGCAHKGSTQSAAAAAAAWPGKNVTTQLIPLARHRSAATATGRKILFITRPPTGQLAGPGEREGADGARESVMHAGVS